MPPAGTAIDQAAGFLESEISRCAQAGSRALPRLVELAAGCHVSHVTMLRAVRRLEAAGRLYTRRGSGIFAGEPTAAQPQALRRCWQTVAAAIEHDVEHGEFGPGHPLPRAKELAERYGVSLPTLHRALGSLVGRRLLQLRRGRFVPQAGKPRPGSAHVLLAVRGWPLQVVSPRESRYEASVAAIDHACSRAGIGVRRVFCEYGRADEPMAISPSLEQCQADAGASTLLGVAMVLRGQDTATVEKLLAFAHLHRKPMAVLDDTGAFGNPALARTRSAAVGFTMATSSACGEAIGRFLLHLGHRRLLFVAPQGPVAWCEQRLQGLQAAYRTAQLPYDLKTVTVPPMPRRWDARVDQVAGALQSRLPGLAEAAPSLRQSEAPSALRDVLRRAAAGRWLDQQLARLLAVELERDAVSAVVGANDEMALACLSALRSAGRRVPQDISVVGFDDTPESAAADLTTYNFDSQAAAQAMLNHILRPGRPGRQTRTVEIRGYVSVRGTTGPRP